MLIEPCLPFVGAITRVVFLHASLYRLDVVRIYCGVWYLLTIWDF